MFGVDPSVVERVWRFLDRQGAQVWLDPEGENLIRAQPDADAPWQVMVQGWPNLVHELAHILQSGSLDEDSGFEYGLVPLDLGTSRGRGYLWDELGACALSCAWCAGYRSKTWVQAWFCEQVEILPVFFGDEANPEAFRAKVDHCLEAYAEELSWVQARLWAMAHHLDCCDAQPKAFREILDFPGRSSARDYLGADPPRLAWCKPMRAVTGAFSVAQLWQEYRESSACASTTCLKS